MKEKNINNAITNVNDELIEHSKSKPIKKIQLWKRWTVTTASVVLIIALGLLTSCDKKLNTGAMVEVVYPKTYSFDDFEAERKVSEQHPVDDNFIEAINEFSYKTSVSVLADDSKNINYSPLSLYYALSLATSGTKGDTEEQLLDLLGCSDQKFLSEQCQNLYLMLYKDNEIGKLKIANSIWMDDELNGKSVKYKDDYMKDAAQNFFASSHCVDFAKKETGKAMADWISTNTNETLTPTIETDSEQILSILNTVYFKDQWINRFDKDKTAEDVFHLADGSELSCDFMNQTFGSAGYVKGNRFTRASLGLKNAGEMVFILPDEGVSPYDLMTSPEEMKRIFEEGEESYGEVVWKIPQFSFGSKLTTLTDLLQSLGVTSAFAADADFGKITNHMVFITDVQQETHIAIDEDGVEASAFTQIDYCGATLPKGRADMILDRPFIYGIKAPNGTLIFIGVCKNPDEK